MKEKVGEEGRMEGETGLVRSHVWILFLVRFLFAAVGLLVNFCRSLSLHMKER